MRTNKLDYTKQLDQLVLFFKKLEANPHLGKSQINKWLKKISPSGTIFSKSQVIDIYRQLAGQHGLKPVSRQILNQLQAKPVRTISGVTPVTVLTKPFPCPGKCIFCPSDVRMPKSYLSNEPGAQRAERNWFDPYLQTYNRLQALKEIGHNTDKVELIVLGGTWNFYPADYQLWFIKELFQALNDFGQGIDHRAQRLKIYQAVQQQLKTRHLFALSDDPHQNQTEVKNFHDKFDPANKTYNQVISELYVAPEKKLGLNQHQTSDWSELHRQHQLNETAASRCVGLVIETRPDNLNQAEVIRLRRLGCTKVQLGVQSLQNSVLRKNKRGHTVKRTAQAFQLLRQAGFKIHAHWMANLYGSSVQQDKQDYRELFSDHRFKPDELKIYPCSLIQSAELMDYYQKGKWKPYTSRQLLSVLKYAFLHTPKYCRLTRVIRDIPSPDIVVGNKKTNFRQLVEQELSKAGQKSKDIRAREIRGQQVTAAELDLRHVCYETEVSREIFLQFVTNDDQKLAAFLRLSLPVVSSLVSELKNAAIIREIHVYGPAVEVGQKADGKTQHLGLGKRLLAEAAQIARDQKLHKLSVISAVGTRQYYRKNNFTDGELYQHLDLSSS